MEEKMATKQVSKKTKKIKIRIIKRTRKKRLPLSLSSLYIILCQMQISLAFHFLKVSGVNKTTTHEHQPCLSKTFISASFFFNGLESYILCKTFHS